MRDTFGPGDWRTLRLAPLWMLVAVSGRQSHFSAAELDSLWCGVDDAIIRSSGLSRDVLMSVRSDRAAVLDEFERENLSVVSGLFRVASILSNRPGDDTDNFAVTMMRLGADLARARGPYGQSISRDDAETLSLLAELLDVGPALSAALS